jgi:drug/metabolite transporter (DMT)-like permease
VGTLSLYQGLAVGRMTVVATLSGVLAAVVPVIVGLALGNSLGFLAALGIAIAIPAILLVSWRPESQGDLGHRAGVPYGLLSGLGFGLLFIGLDRAGTHSGAWPLIPGQLVSVLLIVPFALRGLRERRAISRGPVLLTLLAGVLGGTANLLFLAATGHGELAIVAVLAALYPAVTVLLARVVLSERWSATQTVGLAAAVVAVTLVTVG